MNERDMINILQSDIIIPEIVQEKANMAFEKISQTDMAEVSGIKKKKPRRTKKRLVLKLKDGTVYSYLFNGGSEGYNADDLNTYFATYANNRIIDPNEVAYILFRKGAGGTYSESEFYFVPVN